MPRLSDASYHEKVIRKSVTEITACGLKILKGVLRNRFPC